MVTEQCSVLGRRPIGSDSPICLIPCWQSTRRWLIPWPHQITGVYGEMLPRQPLRFLLAEPAGLLERTRGARQADPGQFARDTERVAKLALDAVLAAERRLHFEPRDVSSDKYGYDVESKIPGTGKLRFTDVKGRAKGANTVTITKNEILTAFNKPEDFILAIVEVDGDAAVPRYLRQPFQREPDFGVTSVNYDWSKLWLRAEEPA